MTWPRWQLAAVVVVGVLWLATPAEAGERPSLDQVVRVAKALQGVSQGIGRDRLLDPLQSQRLTYGLVPVSELQAAVAPVMERLRAAAGEGAPAAQVHITGDPAFNAYALEGGHIFLASGLLRDLESMDELAAVLAHEYVHVWRGHTGQRASERLAAALGGLSTVYLDMRHGEGAVEHHNPDEQFVRQLLLRETALRALQSGVVPRRGRSQEDQADMEGVALMAAAGYNPAAMAEFLYKMERFTAQQAAATVDAGTSSQRMRGVGGMVSRLVHRNDKVRSMDSRRRGDGALGEAVDGMIRGGLARLQRARASHRDSNVRGDAVVAHIDKTLAEQALAQYQPLPWDPAKGVLADLAAAETLLAENGQRLLRPSAEQQVLLRQLATSQAREVPLVRYARLRFQAPEAAREPSLRALALELERDDSLFATHQLVLELLSQRGDREQALVVYQASRRSFNDAPDLIPYGVRLYQRAGKADLARNEVARCVATGDERLAQACQQAL